MTARELIDLLKYQALDDEVLVDVDGDGSRILPAVDVRTLEEHVADAIVPGGPPQARPTIVLEVDRYDRRRLA